MENWELQQKQSLPLEIKIIMTQQRIREWYEYWDGDVYVSFSGGKDSSILLHLVRGFYPNVPAVFVNTGLEFPEIRNFVRTIDNVTILRPAMPYPKVLEKYGYPVVSKEQAGYIDEYKNATNKKFKDKRSGRFGNSFAISMKWQFLVNAPFKISDKCCDVMKKRPFKIYEKQTHTHAFLGVMASDSDLRMNQYLRHGCNAFELKNPRSTPMAFWLEKDVWDYIHTYHIPYSSIYDMGYHRTGCMFCMFGVHLEKPPNRFERMKETHPKQWDYCINKLGLGKILDYIGIRYYGTRQRYPKIL